MQKIVGFDSGSNLRVIFNFLIQPNKGSSQSSQLAYQYLWKGKSQVKPDVSEYALKSNHQRQQDR